MTKNENMVYEKVDRDTLIVENIALVKYIALKYINTMSTIPFVDMDDLVSVRTIGLIKGIDSFNPDKGAKLSTYLSKCINNEILMHIRQFKRRMTEVSLDEPICTNDNGRQIPIIDLLVGDDNVSDFMYSYETSDTVRYLFSKLKPTERLIISLRYGFTGDIMSQNDVASYLMYLNRM